MSDTDARAARRRSAAGTCTGAGNAVYFLGQIGALVLFWQQAASFGGHLLAVLKSVVSPAFQVHEVFAELVG